tara:strand:+ start:45 stop:392 length:348 start_codon:yes stop_codon:yes gene_type:complete
MWTREILMQQAANSLGLDRDPAGCISISDERFGGSMRMHVHNRCKVAVNYRYCTMRFARNGECLTLEEGGVFGGSKIEGGETRVIVNDIQAGEVENLYACYAPKRPKLTSPTECE